MRHRISDWDDAYANGPNIPGGDRWPDLWVGPAREYRHALGEAGHANIDLRYGDGARNSERASGKPDSRIRPAGGCLVAAYAAIDTPSDRPQ